MRCSYVSGARECELFLPYRVDGSPLFFIGLTGESDDTVSRLTTPSVISDDTVSLVSDREQTAEHRDLILTVFERLTSLQQLVLDRFSWFNSLAHYVAGVLLVYLLTSTARTAGAR